MAKRTRRTISESVKVEAMDLIQRHGWTHRAAAAKLGINASLIGYWKRTHEAKPSPRMAHRPAPERSVALVSRPVEYGRAVAIGVAFAAMKATFERTMRRLAEGPEAFTEADVADLVTAMDASLATLR